MGGEQYPILVYGPKQKRSVHEWVRTFGLVSKYDDAFDAVDTFLKSHHMTMVFDNNCCWDSPCVGMEVPDFETFTGRDSVVEFCSRFKLPAPTFYAGLVGELE